jgi:hypothetical protein
MLFKHNMYFCPETSNKQKVPVPKGPATDFRTFDRFWTIFRKVLDYFQGKNLGFKKTTELKDGFLLFNLIEKWVLILFFDLAFWIPLGRDFIRTQGTTRTLEENWFISFTATPGTVPGFDHSTAPCK